MKKCLLTILVFFTLFTTGCLKRDTMEDILIYTSAYPIKYITEQLYGNNSTIQSIYPNGIIINKYTSYYEFDDLYQVSIIGMIKAYQNFDCSKGVKFTTYAYKYILSEVLLFINNKKGSRDGKKKMQTTDKYRLCIGYGCVFIPCTFVTL